MKFPRIAGAVMTAGLLLGGCASDAPGEGVGYRYLCNDGTAFYARTEPGQLVLSRGGGPGMILPAMAGGGYGDGSQQVRISGPTLTVTSAQGQMSCSQGDVRDFIPR